MNYTIKKANSAILPEVAQLNQQIFKNLVESEPFALIKFKILLKKRKLPLILIAETDGKLVGFMISFKYKNCFHIWNSGVLTKYRKFGIATSFFEKTESFAKNHRFPGITTKTFNNSPEMLRLLIKRGYHITRVEKSTASSKYHAIHLKLSL